MLPFANLGGDEQQDHFSSGVTQDIPSEFARAPNMFVPTGNSTRRYDPATADLKQIGRELVVRYVLEGSVEKSGDQLRVSAQLIEIESGA